MSPRREVQPLREEIVATPASAVSEAPRATLLAAGVLLDLRVQGRQCEAALEPHGLLPAAVVGGATLPGSGTIVLRIVGRTLNGDALTSVRVRAEKLVVADDVYTVTGGEAELPVRQFARGSAASNVATGAVAGAVLGAILSHGKLKGTLAGAAAGAAVGGVVTTAARESCLADGTPLTVRLSAPALATDR
jgi:outer membrane lipoprotein SlyB